MLSAYLSPAVLSVVHRVRTEPSKPSNVLEFVFSVQVPSIVLKFNSMFSNVLETKCLENAIILAVYWRKELNKFAPPRQHPVKKGATRTAAERMLGSRRPRVTRAEVAPKRKRPMAASDINDPSDMCFRLAFSPVLCAMDLCRVLLHFYAIGYTLCLAGIGTVCSEVSG